jgi:hypothetical protein
MQQSPASVFLVRPVSFGFNPETALSNAFQQQPTGITEEIRLRAINEFDQMVNLLQLHDIDVRIFEDTPQPAKPDAQFPNNWISFHEDGKVVLYPMMAANRRFERRADIIEEIRKDFRISSVVDFSDEEEKGRYLEGTGSLVFDYVNKIAYANRSPRTDEQLVEKVCKELGYRPVVFDAVDEYGKPIYHTNVLMGIGSNFVVICLDVIHGDEDQEKLLTSFSDTAHKVVAISYTQMSAFAGNIIEVRTRTGEPVVLISDQALTSLLPGQVDAISRHAELIPISIPTIEKFGGGSVRCMIAGNFLPAYNSKE